MARIPLGNFGTSAPEPVPNPRIPAAAALDLAGVERAGNMLATAGMVLDSRQQYERDRMERIKREQDELDTRSWLAREGPRADMDVAAALDQLETDAKPGAKGHTERAVEAFRRVSHAVQDRAPSPLAIKAWNDYAPQLEARAFARARDFEVKARLAERVDSYDAGIEASEKLVSLDPSRAQEQLQLLADMVPSENPVVRSELLKKAWDRISTTALKAEIIKNPSAMLSTIEKSMYAEPVQRNTATGETRPLPDTPAWKSKARGIRNNNPGNLVKGGQGFEGEVPGTDARFLTFDNAESGIRAMGKVLLRYRDRGIDTIEALAERWAPASENDSKQYAAHLSKLAGFAPDQTIDLGNEETLRKVVPAIIQIENGEQPYAEDAVGRGVAAALGYSIPDVKLLGEAPPGERPQEPLPPTAEGAQSGQWQIRSNPIPTGNTLLSRTSIAQREELLRFARQEADRQGRGERQSLEAEVDDYVAAARSGKVPPPIARDRILRVFGQDVGARVADEVQAWGQVAGKIGEAATMTPAGRVELLKQMEPKAGLGFRDQAARYQALGNALAGIEKQLADDPASFVQQHNADARTKFESMQRVLMSISKAEALMTPGLSEQASAVAQDYAATAAALIAKTGGDPNKILPAAYAETLARQFTTLAKGGEAAVQLIEGQAQLWGKYWPQVYGQLSKDLAPAVRVISNMGNTGAARVLANAAQTPTKELREVLQGSDAKRAEDGVDAALSRFRLSLSHSDGGRRAFGDFREQAHRYAFILMQQGMSPDAAAEKAAEDVVNRFYTFHETGAGGSADYRVPIAMHGDLVARGADRLVAELKGPFLIDMPAEQRKALGEAWISDQIASSIRSRGHWVTDGTESGLVLGIRGADGSLWGVQRPDGQHVRYSWAELEAAGAQREVAPAGTEFVAP